MSFFQDQSKNKVLQIINQRLQYKGEKQVMYIPELMGDPSALPSARLIIHIEISVNCFYMLPDQYKNNA